VIAVAVRNEGLQTAAAVVITGDDLVKMRRVVGLSQAELARRLSYSQSYMCQLEHGRRMLPRYRYSDVMDILLRASQEQDRMRQHIALVRGV
jgi:predicted transcriptional regulator